MTEGPEGSREPQPRAPEEAKEVTSHTEGSDAAGTTEYGSAVERINDVLRSAELAAEAIRAEAVSKAEEIRRAATEEGQRHLSEVKEEAARVREAEQRVDKMLADAEGQARATREAEEDAARRVEALREREEKLRAYIGPLETTLSRALEGFRRITAQLEKLLDDQEAREGETLVEALSEPVRRTGEREETAPPQERPSG